jgi:hypothetical protein
MGSSLHAPHTLYPWLLPYSTTAVKNHVAERLAMSEIHRLYEQPTEWSQSEPKDRHRVACHFCWGSTNVIGWLLSANFRWLIISNIVISKRNCELQSSRTAGYCFPPIPVGSLCERKGVDSWALQQDKLSVNWPPDHPEVAWIYMPKKVVSRSIHSNENVP